MPFGVHGRCACFCLLWSRLALEKEIRGRADVGSSVGAKRSNICGMSVNSSTAFAVNNGNF